MEHVETQINQTNRNSYRNTEKTGTQTERATPILQIKAGITGGMGYDKA